MSTENIELDDRTSIEVDKKFKITEEVAEQFVDDWAEGMDLDFDENDMDSDDLGNFRKSRKKIVKGFMTGAIRLNDNHEIVYTPQNTNSRHQEPITFHERTGNSIMASDAKKRGQDARKQYAVMAEMCKVQVSVFGGLVGIDIKTCEAIFILLMD